MIRADRVLKGSSRMGHPSVADALHHGYLVEMQADDSIPAKRSGGV
jgi:hypothetical protein